MPYVKFATAANAQFDVGVTVINLAEQLKSDGNIKELRKGDTVIVRVNGGQPIRYLVDGNVPTDALGNITSSGFSVKGQFIERINLIRDAASSADSEVCVTIGNGTVAVDQILQL